jgi:hypothetical protein
VKFEIKGYKMIDFLIAIIEFIDRTLDYIEMKTLELNELVL